MGTEHELKDAISSTEQLIGQISQSYRSGIDISFAKGAVVRARSVLATNDEPATQRAWVEVTVAQAALSAQTYARYKELHGAPSLNRASIKSKMDAYLSSMRTALSQIFAKPESLDALPELGVESGAVYALAGMAVEVAANDVDSAAAWIYRCRDKVIAAAKASADAKASASASANSANSANSASGVSNKRKL